MTTLRRHITHFGVSGKEEVPSTQGPEGWVGSGVMFHVNTGQEMRKGIACLGELKVVQCVWSLDWR